MDNANTTDTASMGYLWADGSIRRERPPAPKTWRIPAPPACAHESVTSASGHGAYCRFCGETVS